MFYKEIRVISHGKNFVSFTHNYKIVLSVAKLFALILYAVFQAAFDAAISSKDKPCIETIQEFGVGCPIDGAFETTIHLLATNKDFEEAIILNAKAGGDSVARGMVVGMIMDAAGHEIPKKWKEETRGL